MMVVIKNLISFILPFTVLVLVPAWIEHDRSVKHIAIFCFGISVMCVGLFVMVLTISMFIKIGKGTLAPWSPTRRLVIRSVYAHVRNPMILGVWIVLIGESIAIESWNIVVWSLAFLVINTIFFLAYEEPNLKKRFGEEYMEYKKNVPRWIPRLTPYKPE